MSKDTSTFSVSAAKALFESAKRPEVRNAAIAAAKNPFVRQTAKNVAQDEKARGAVLNAVKDPSGGNKISAAFAVADANRKSDSVPPPPPHRGGTSPGKLSGSHSAIRSQLENMHIGGSVMSSNSSTATPSYQSNSTSSYSSSAPVAPPPVPRHTQSIPSYSAPAISTPYGIAKFDYAPTQSDEMGLRIGDTVLISKKVDAEWFYGENQNQRTFGIVPSSYLDIKIPLKEAFTALPPRPAAPSGSSSGTYATAIYDYNSNEAGDLNFAVGSQIMVTARVNEEWLEGECFGRSGIFPSQFVDCPNLYQVPMKQSAPSSAPSYSHPITNNSGPKQTVTVSYDYDSGVASDLRLFEGDVIEVMSSRFLRTAVARATQQRSMYENPYINRFKARSKVSEDFHKKTTGITGLFVNEHPHRALTVVYGRILRALEQIPRDAAYRKYTEAVVKQRLALVQAENDIKKLEEKIGMGQIEEVIEQAEYELETTRAIVDSKAWEPLVESAPKGQWSWPV